MKKLKLLVILMFAVLMIPVGVFAEENEEVNVYFFKGDGCGYCEAGLEWFGEIEDRYGERFKLHEYETWYDEENAKLMEAVAKVRGEQVSGVPYIIVGNQSWNGFDKSYEDEILDKIKSEYKKADADRYDVMDYVENAPADKKDKKDGNADDIAITVLLLVVVAGVGLGIYSLRKTN
jgi:thiol-disulfide isomerase/thioredoxin